MILSFATGAWYSDCDIFGNRASLFGDSHILLNGERVSLPGENVLHLVQYGGIYLAGQGHQTNTAWFYDKTITQTLPDGTILRGKWKNLGATIGGGNTCCFDEVGNLYFVSGGNQFSVKLANTDEIKGPYPHSIGVNGIRRVTVVFNEQTPNAGIITGDDTYGSGEYKLAEYTPYKEFGPQPLGLAAGQSYIKDDACTIHYGKNYVLIDQNSRHIRLHSDGVQLAIAAVNYHQGGATFAFLKATEIESLPLEKVEAPKPDEPKEPEKPKPEEPKVMAPDEVEAVKRQLRLHPEVDVLDDDDRGRILNFVIKDLKSKYPNEPWGRKSRNSSGTDLNTDVLGFKFADGKIEWIDVLLGSDPNPSNPDRGKYASWSTDHKKWNQGDNGFWVKAGEVKPDEPNTEPKEPTKSLPPNVNPITYPPGYVGPKNLHDWIHVEYPQLVQAYKDTHNGDEPNHEWAAFQTCRRYGAGLPPGEPAWTLEKMLKHEQEQ